ncbi:MAG: hypothetical protein ACPGVB_10195 [Chitinophagales bacterium]
MLIQVEKTEDAVVIKLPLNTKASDIQNVVNYFKYVELVGKSKATQEQIDELAKEAKKGWWEKNKARFKGVEGFEDLV